MERSRQYVESCRKEIEDISNSKGEPNTDILDFVYKWHFEYINNIGFMPNECILAFTRTIQYMEQNVNTCVICYSVMDILPNVYVNTIYLTSCFHCHMPICSNCIYAASQVSKQCPSCYQSICTIELSYDEHILVKKTAADHVRIHQLINSRVVLADDLELEPEHEF
jgi:hypothetical protein